MYTATYWKTYSRRLTLLARGKRLRASMVPTLEQRVKFLAYVLADMSV